MDQPRLYPQWRPESAARWRDAFNTLGYAWLSNCRSLTKTDMPRGCSVEEAATYGAHQAIYALMMLLEGVVGVEADQQHDIEFLLSVRIRSKDSNDIVEEIELAPDGEESPCMGCHSWAEGDFRG